ncbi:MAG TPA: PaaI family thioesterase [Bacteroidales bacterium]|jgi:uncharacterized protein (TIGR00369 family)|nr:PaaI family thioesterase [Bacteroidales bacterium]HNT71317.1 PaaI family thioesterase [Bacteroidales bacterium]HNY75784.1 PaaI family thioesterase [Bacteroidales bacterium]HOC40451.1 PaaI family thioesterase [Bacteroidales bacterium]HOF07320.1 PaaI family thioesterase [Bacteroidales bacterium]
MKKIKKESWNQQDDFCFGCSEKNPVGLQLDFYDYGDYVESEWIANKNYEGWHGVLHGGIVATLLDEVGSWVIISKIGRAGMTVELNVRYHKKISTNEKIYIQGKLIEHKRNIAVIESKIIQNGEIKASAISKYFLFDQKTSKEVYNVDETHYH